MLLARARPLTWDHGRAQVVPANVTWGGQAGDVFSALAGDFMRPVATGDNSVDSLLADGRIGVNVYSGQLDLICCTTGTEAWMARLAWPGMKSFYSSAKDTLYPHDASGAPLYDQAVYRKSYAQLSLYYVNVAGHMVPADNGDGALVLLKHILFA